MLYAYNPLKDDASKDILKLNGDGYLITYKEVEMPVVSNRDFLDFYRFSYNDQDKEILYIMRGLDLE